MDVNNSAYEQNSDYAGKCKENSSGDGNHVNGMSNGYSSKHKSHKSDHKEKHRDRDRDRDKDKERPKAKDHKSSSGSSNKERHSSGSKDKERSSHGSHKNSGKDKERSGDKDNKERSGEKDNKERSGDKEKHRDNKHRDEKKSSGSSGKEHKSSKEHRDRDKSSGTKDKEKEREKHKHSSSSSKDKEKHSSSGSSKDKHRDKDKHHSSSKDKSKKDRDKHKAEKESNNDNNDKRREPIELEQNDWNNDDVKKEPQNDSYETKHRVHDKEDVNVSAASSCDYNLSAFKDEPTFKQEPDEDSEEDIPLSSRVDVKRKKADFDDDDDDDDDTPLVARKKPRKEPKEKKVKVKKRRVSSDEEEVKPIKKEKKPKIKSETENSPKKKKKKVEEEQEVWKWWEEEKKDDSQKWTFLEHKGPVFAPPYERLPSHVKFFYKGNEVRLSESAEEVAGFYAKMLDHDYTTKPVFNNNFFNDWRKVMNKEELSLIKDLEKCNFKQMHTYFTEVAEKNRNRTKEEKKELKEKNEEIMKEYGFCTIDGHKEKIGNFKIEPPGLFRGRGEHPKMGMLKKRVLPENVLINCSKNSKTPEPPPGHRWKQVRHDPKVTWLASWTENVQNQVKYVMLNPSSRLKGEKDWQKYETARTLAKSIEKIRTQYKDDWKSKEMRIRQRAVALYFIDRLALRAGNEKDEEQADTVGCCSLRVEHIELHEQKDGKEYVVVFDFLGKDSIRYYNEVPVEKRVFKNLQLFMENKQPGDDLFDRLNTSVMNKHLNELMEGLTAKVFRTYNASYTLQQQLDELTNEDDSISEKILSYNRANRAVAILCNHQRSVPKGHNKTMEKLKEKIDAKKDSIKELQMQVKDAQNEAKRGSVKEKIVYDKKKKALERLKEQLVKLEVMETDKDENKAIALGTSKLNYLDPRISVAWCKKYEVPIEKIYNKTQRDKFRWAIDMAGPEYRF